MKLKHINDTKFVSWHIVYKKFAYLLYEFYNHYKEETSIKLFELFMNDYEFKKLNRWTHSYLKWEVYSLDPIHIFASFNYAGIDKDLRIRKLELYFKILGSELDCMNINFSGIPSPNITRIMSARNIETQKEIWSFFSSIIRYKQNGLDDLFERVKFWYGLGVPSITIFMFWVDSDVFFPLDKNTIKLLKDNEMQIPYNTQEYKEIIEENLEDDGVFRELARIAYE